MIESLLVCRQSRLAMLIGLTLFSSLGSASAAPHREVVRNRAPLAEPPMLRLPIGSVRPRGWLRSQLELQKVGLTGSAEQIYDALQANSGWLGGDGASWEKPAYYAKGLLALAYTLDDNELKSRAQKWIDWVFVSQSENGFFGPKSNDDWWPRMVVLYYLRDDYEATGDQRVVPFLLKYFRYQLEQLPQRPLRDWGRARAGDNIEIVLWTYNLTGESWLLDLARLLHQQAYPWTEIFTHNQFYGRFKEFHPQHIVNVSQALKFSPVVWQLTNNPSDEQAYRRGIVHLEREYGRIDGQVSGTEMLSGRSSTDGVELCADVERIVSGGVAMRILGDATIGDEIEKVAYNSLPAHTTKDLTGITYYQLQNQVQCVHTPHGFKQDYGNAIVPGPHSGFPCCCYNWHMGWPKFVESMWAATNDQGLASVLYGPCEVKALVAEGVEAKITATTDYPFKESVSLQVQLEQPAKFPLLVRIPAWCEAAEVSVNGERTSAPAKAGTFCRLERDWKSGDQIELRFPMQIRTSRWINDSIGVERGPLAYGLMIDEHWTKSADYLDRFDEFTITPGSDWNYALRVEEDQPAQSFKVEEREVGPVPWALEAAPVILTATARKVPEWRLEQPLDTAILGRSDHGWNEISRQSISAPQDGLHRLRVVMDGAKYRIYFNDMKRPVFEGEDSHYTQGSIGLRTYQATASFQDIKLNGNLIDDARLSADSWTSYGAPWKHADGQLLTQNRAIARALLKNARAKKKFSLEAKVHVAEGGDAGIIFRVSEPGEGTDNYRGYYLGVSAAGRKGDAAEPPPSPVQSSEADEQVRLVPFGSTKLRVVYFPQLAD